jgi:hypothetical protein
MNGLNPLNSGFNPLSFLGGANGSNPLEGADPLQLLMSLFGNQSAAQQGQEQGQVCGCGGGGSCSGGACGCGCSCCQKNNELGF